MDKNRYREEDFNDFLEDLIKSGRIEGKEAGIAKLVLDKGYDALSDKQKYVFDKMIDCNTVSRCKLDGNEIPWNEMFDALDNGGYCSHCQYILDDDD